MQVVSELLSSILQVLACALIPFVFFLARNDKTTSFTTYIGLVRPTTQPVELLVGATSLIAAIGLVAAIFLGNEWRQVALDPNTVTGRLRAIGFNAPSLSIVLMTAWIKTSLAEEILFRGFLMKLLTEKLGSKLGNLIQALVFGAIHLVLFGFLTQVALLSLIIIFCFSTLAGWMMGLMKLRQQNGSIIPGWIAHGLGNTLAYVFISYLF